MPVIHRRQNASRNLCFSRRYAFFSFADRLLRVSLFLSPAGIFQGIESSFQAAVFSSGISLRVITALIKAPLHKKPFLISGAVDYSRKAKHGASFILPLVPKRNNRPRCHFGIFNKTLSCNQKLHRPDNSSVVCPVKAGVKGKHLLRKPVVGFNHKLIFLPEPEPGGQFHHKGRIPGI